MGCFVLYFFVFVLYNIFWWDEVAKMLKNKGIKRFSIWYFIIKYDTKSRTRNISGRPFGSIIEGSSPSRRTSGENGIFACFRFFKKWKVALLHLFSPLLAPKLTNITFYIISFIACLRKQDGWHILQQML